ncbi:MAG: lysophospholipid acyltransferase family protein [Candidatus Electrothrix scaldis]|nr:MAG: lysophospholipid acyltransferase family protein [Candidatus Electrothrix sp. GW3-3]
MLSRGIDFCITLLYWVWFIFGFLFIFSWRYVAALFSSDSERTFQGLNSRFFQILLSIIGRTAPGQKICIDNKVAAIRSSVIICNHLSYLDPLLLIALFPRHRTIVKPRFFLMPIFGQIIATSGYLPGDGGGRFSRLMIHQMDSMPKFLQAGGNLFVFPEGTRSRSGEIGTMQQGAIKIARLLGAPIYLLQLRNTEKLFPPGKFLFATRKKNRITLKVLQRLETDGASPPSATQLMRKIEKAYRSAEP